jgi:hypothetical protein
VFENKIKTDLRKKRIEKKTLSIWAAAQLPYPLLSLRSTASQPS